MKIDATNSVLVERAAKRVGSDEVFGGFATPGRSGLSGESKRELGVGGSKHNSVFAPSDPISSGRQEQRRPYQHA
jgi:hypothetical protein